MSKTSATSPSLPKSKVRTEANEVRQSEMELSDIAAERAKRREEKLRTVEPEALRIFNGGVERWPQKESNFASEIGVTKSIVSDIKTGKRILKAADFLLLIGNPEAPETSAYVLGELARLAGGRFVRNRKTSRSEAERGLGKAARAVPVIYAALREIAAQMANTDTLDLDAAFEESEVDDLSIAK